ncbi:hypothetical protein D3C74_458420 [compost metagenome]
MILQRLLNRSSEFFIQIFAQDAFLAIDQRNLLAVHLEGFHQLHTDVSCANDSNSVDLLRSFNNGIGMVVVLREQDAVQLHAFQLRNDWP